MYHAVIFKLILSTGFPHGITESPGSRRRTSIFFPQWVPTLKRKFSHLKMDGYEPFLLGPGLFSGANC